MDKKKLLIIGRNSFLGKSLYFGLKKKINTRLLSYEKFLKLEDKELKKINYICNCAINPKYVKLKYKKKNDIDLKIINKIINLDISFIFLSTRKVYLNKANIKETEKTNPKCNYSKNKLITEKAIYKLIKNKALILRISNILGLKKKNLRRTHISFIDNYIKYLSSNKKIYYTNDFKDFITIRQFIEIFLAVINNKLNGTYNISLNKKIYTNEILNWLNYKNINKGKFFIKKNSTLKDSFTLNNYKLIDSINIKIKKSEVKKFCQNMGRIIYNKYNYSI
jgi:dTDP-4-dehydrorhamnose reductase